MPSCFTPLDDFLQTTKLYLGDFEEVDVLLDTSGEFCALALE